jgi:predicted component of type VI protein secretion system
MTADGWSVDTTKASFLGVTAHWVDVKKGKWKLQAEVIGF